VYTQSNYNYLYDSVPQTLSTKPLHPWKVVISPIIHKKWKKRTAGNFSSILLIKLWELYWKLGVMLRGLDSHDTSINTPSPFWDVYYENPTSNMYVWYSLHTFGLSTLESNCTENKLRSTDHWFSVDSKVNPIKIHYDLRNTVLMKYQCILT
jgi:hypothetical protein